MNGRKIEWKQLWDIFEKLAAMSAQSQGLTLAPKLKREHLKLTSYLRMRVDLAAQVRFSYTCMYAHTQYTRTHARTHTHTHTHTHAHTHTHVHTHTHTCTSHVCTNLVVVMECNLLCYITHPCTHTHTHTCLGIEQVCSRSVCLLRRS